jgi:hypothetical protein
VEARRVAQLVDALPEPRRAEVQARFEAALTRLADAGLLETLRHPGPELGGGLRSLGETYFHLGIACPFLEDESCSIHLDRPISCREYLVTSPAENCARPSPAVRCVPMAAKVSAAVRGMEWDDAPDSPVWVPLILALEWAAAHPDGPPNRTGPEWIQDLFGRLTGQAVPAPPA